MLLIPGLFDIPEIGIGIFL